MDINDILNILRTAYRIGIDKDEPEGSRYIQLSDTLVDDIAISLENIELELKINNKLLVEQNRVLSAIPGCPAHGERCVPYALEWIKRVKNTLHFPF